MNQSQFEANHGMSPALREGDACKLVRVGFGFDLTGVRKCREICELMRGRSEAKPKETLFNFDTQFKIALINLIKRVIDSLLMYKIVTLNRLYWLVKNDLN